jgi:predicted unusual protein kinase regulating ubiquinone biosynthesis (AarF/ABC1/UbiB family)/nucleotide-binding universal stress UspA family protein
MVRTAEERPATADVREDAPMADPVVRRVLVATDRSATADAAVRWAAVLADAHRAELILARALAPAEGADATEAARCAASEDLTRFATEVAGPRGRARVVVDDDPSRAIVAAAEAEKADVLVVGNVGMSERTRFLLGNVPNRVSHNARCTVVIVNTAQIVGAAGSQEPPARGTRSRSATGDRSLLPRAWRIGRVLARAGVGELRRRGRGDAGDERARAHRLRAALEELGPTFGKLGQILSTRPDLLPPALVEELADLQEHVVPLTEAEVVAAMERELGVPWEDVFASIDPKPLAAGTIAQVHRATLDSGERVVVKVQRPTAESDILQDLGLLELFAAKAAARPGLRRAFDIPGMIEQLSASLRRELDFRQEAANLERMRAVLAPYPRLAVPAHYSQYSTARLLVMEEVQGVPVLQAPDGPARADAGRQLLEAYYHQVMTEGFFHADPHPGNMKWWNDRIYLLDLGMVGEVDATVRELILLMLLAFAEGDAAFLAETVLTLAGGSQGTELDQPAFRAELAGLIGRYGNLSMRDIQLGPLFQEVGEIAVRHNVRVPAALGLAGKAFSQMQLVAAELDPTLDPFAVARAFVVRSTVRQLTGGLSPQRTFYEVRKALHRAHRALAALEAALAGSGGGIEIKFRGTEGVEATVAQAGRRVALAMGTAGALVGTAMVVNSERAPRWLPTTMGGFGTLLAARLLAELRRPSR